MTTIYITRHGESTHNTKCKIGGDSSLTKHGVLFAKRLFTWSECKPNLRVWTSATKRTQETVIAFPETEVVPKLNEINAGICENMTYQEVESLYPHIHEARNNDKYNFVYPGGESYHHLYMRVSQAISKLGNQPTLIVCHRAVIRMLISILCNKSAETCVDVDIPLHTVFVVDRSKETVVEKINLSD
jgi:6-phosphofructo-2-kinase/fructose-2,6-biphosphatase 2